MTDSDRSPFRCFPWVQLVFCVACLAMTAWTWMRYSYAWEAKPSELGEWYYYRYVRCAGYTGVAWRGPLVLKDGPDTWNGAALDTGRWHEPGHDGLLTVSGRYLPKDTPASFDTLYAGACRFYPASIAGIVVGAMGCCIFGLYLRAWLKERKAAA